jgi:hypothetical protein
MDEDNSNIKRRRRLQPQETDFLLRVFEIYPRPNAAMRDILAHRLGMSPRGIQIWFQNRRAKVKRDFVESGHAMLLFQPTTPMASTDLFATDSPVSLSPDTSPGLDNDMLLPTVEQLEDLLNSVPAGLASLELSLPDYYSPEPDFLAL